VVDIIVHSPAAHTQPGAANSNSQRVLSYSVKDAATVIGVSKTTIWRLIAAGEIHTFKLGCRTLIRADELQALIDRHSQAA